MESRYHNDMRLLRCLTKVFQTLDGRYIMGAYAGHPRAGTPPLATQKGAAPSVPRDVGHRAKVSIV